jgi:hypothetical protein
MSKLALVWGHVASLPKLGCAFWQREPGADDELRGL